MTKHNHRAVGLAVACVAAMLIPDQLSALVFGAGVIWASTAPDWLEMPTFRSKPGGGFIRESAIPHRTLTHWWPLWIAIAAGGVATGGLLGSFIAGAGAGGLTHLLCDIPNPMGIPLRTPFGKRTSWRLWTCGSRPEHSVAMLITAASVGMLLHSLAPA